MGFALAASIADAVALGVIQFARDTDQNGPHSFCDRNLYNKCYDAPMNDASSMSFLNTNFPNHREFSITLFTGPKCTGRYDRWSFEQKRPGGVDYNKFPSVNDKVVSYKISNYITSRVVNGDAGATEEQVFPTHCKDFRNSAAVKNYLIRAPAAPKATAA
ncbi:hypothetical protein BGZ96_008956 [Linnemannia gamsii]|uniref:Uncharacterized protein n=1 Tax=Linnemannia gamsii TaxID=64522 RepID=A0ABQ7JZ97_9FUNG|nr:hypothetical protein BGZ96_008956 [Linnemannia gamsii]